MSADCLLIDGSGFIYRAYYGYPKLTKFDGTQIGAVYGFCSMILALLKHSTSRYCAVVFDNGRRTFRTEKYPEYKANRRDTPEDLILQFPLIREACTAFGLTILAKDGFEADDLIATFTKRFKEQNNTVEIVSSDKDLLQLIEEGVCVYDPVKSKYMHREETFERFGVFPEQIRDYLSLVGDASDNVPGVEGIGSKTAVKLLKQFGSIDGIWEEIAYKNCENISVKIAQKFKDAKEKIELSKWLVSLKYDVDYDISISELKNTGINYNSLYEFYRGNGFKLASLQNGIFDSKAIDVCEGC